MNAVTRLLQARQFERSWRPRLGVAAMLVVVLAALAACGKQSDTQVASDAFAAGYRAQVQGRPAEAITDYKLVLSKDPRNKLAYYDLGVAQQQLGQNTAAEASYRALLQLDPNYVAALYNLAILRTAPSPAEAEALYRHIISLQPNHTGAHLNLGFLLRTVGRVEEGNAELRTAVALDPSVAQRIPPAALATPAPPTPSAQASPTPSRRP
jgi:tetratricopeptide (TPR) repeat protein